MVRSAIRAVLRAARQEATAKLRRLLSRDDDHAITGKPACDWDEPAA